jgi:hypothetical protein
MSSRVECSECKIAKFYAAMQFKKPLARRLFVRHAYAFLVLLPCSTLRHMLGFASIVNNDEYAVLHYSVRSIAWRN